MTLTAGTSPGPGSNAQRNPNAALVVDDVLSPLLCWQEAVGYGGLQREPEASSKVIRQLRQEVGFC